jgi:hypothetical protein
MDGFSDYQEEDLGLDAVEVVVEETDNVLETNNNIFEENIIDTSPSETVLDELLRVKGITDSMVTIVDENEIEKEVNFYDLSREEQLEILNMTEVPINEELDGSEIDLINHLRTNNLSIDEFLNQYKDAILAEAQQLSEPTYDIDTYDDQELFLLDLKEKYDLTDEELKVELEKELANVELFTKKVTKLRTEYKQLEDQYKAQQQTDFESERQEQYDQFSNAMLNIADGVEDFHGVFLEDNEKTETLSYLLDLDETGVSQFSKDLNDPQKLYEAAWYMRYGAEAFKALENAYEEEIAKLKKVDKPRVVVRNSEKKVNSIYDLN